MISILTLSRTPSLVQDLSRALDACERPTAIERLLIHPGSMNMTALALRQGWLVAEANAPYTFSSGNNLIAGAAQGSHLLLLNDDARPAPDCIARLWEARDQAEVLGTLIFHRSGTVNHAGSLVDAGTLRTDHIGRHAPAEQWDRKDIPLRPAVTFACVLIRRDWWEKLGGLDERYVWGWEDTDFCLRTIEAGGSVRVDLGARVTHDECGTRPRNGPRDMDNYTLFHRLWAGPRVGGALVRYVQRHGFVEGCLVT